ncbi:MAG: hypothetical protein K8S55_05775 [Phycisphaerae bacterium]|nr:hypothetical protein [Phycisphaerae bacterium]
MKRRMIVITSMCFAYAIAVFGQVGPPKPNTTHDKYLVASIPLLHDIDLGLKRTGRFSDMAISPDGTKAWLCDDLYSKTVTVFDIATGKHLKCFGGLSTPSHMRYHTATKRLYVVNEDKSLGAIIRVYDTTTGKLERSIPVHDWRLYRVASAAFSPDCSQLWLTSSPTSSSLYGNVSAALFRINLKNGKWRQIYGPRLPEKGKRLHKNAVLAYPDNPSRILCIAMDSSGRLFAINLKHGFVSVFPVGADKPTRELKVDCVPSHLCHTGKERLLIAGKGRIIIIDTKTMKYKLAAYIVGTPTAVCADSAGERAYIAIVGSNDVLVMHIKKTRSVAFARPVRLPSPNIQRLFFLDKPERLVGIGSNGYRPFVLNLETGALLTRNTGNRPKAYKLRIDRRTHKAVVTFDNGRIVIADLKPGGTTRMIALGHGMDMMDAVFTGKDTVLVSDMRNKQLLSIDLVSGRVLGNIYLENCPYGLALSDDGKSVGIVFGWGNAPRTAVVDLVTSKAKYYSKTEELPDAWKNLHERASGRVSRGKNTNVSIHMATWADIATITLQLSNGKKAVFTLPGRYFVPKDISVAIGSDEKFAYVLSDHRKPVLLKFRLSPID